MLIQDEDFDNDDRNKPNKVFIPRKRNRRAKKCGAETNKLFPEYFSQYQQFPVNQSSTYQQFPNINNQNHLVNRDPRLDPNINPMASNYNPQRFDYQHGANFRNRQQNWYDPRRNQ